MLEKRLKAGKRTKPASQTEIQSIVESQMRWMRIRVFDPLQYECLEVKRLARIQESLRNQFRELLCHRAGRPDTDGRIGRLEAKIERQIGWFDERERLFQIRTEVADDGFRMDDLLAEISDDDIDRFEQLLYGKVTLG